MKVNVSPELPRAVKQQIVREARKEVVRQHEQFGDDYDAVILWVLHERFGFGPERLRRYYDAFIDEYAALKAFYCGEDAAGRALHDDVACFACKMKLREIGVDIAEWNKKI